MRFGRLPADDSLSSKALLVEHKQLEEKLATMNRIIEEDRLKAHTRQNQAPKAKAFSIRNMRRPSRQKDQTESTQASNPQLKPVFAKKGIRAYEEVVKNKLLAKKQGSEDLDRKNAELLAFLDSLKLGKLLEPFKKGGIVCLEDLRSADLKKFNLLPGFELKLLKKLAELPGQLPLKRESLLQPPGSRESLREKQQLRTLQDSSNRSSRDAEQALQASEDEDYLVNKRPLPPALPKARKYHTLVTRLKSLHEDSTMSEVRRAQTCDTGCGAQTLPPRIGCWFCATLLEPDSQPVRHPVFAHKVGPTHRDLLFSRLHALRVPLRRCAVSLLSQDRHKARRPPPRRAVVLLPGLLRQSAGRVSGDSAGCRRGRLGLWPGPRPRDARRRRARP